MSIEIPYDTWQAIQARIVLDSSEEVFWTGKAVIQRAPKFEDEEIEVTYIARYHQGHLGIDMRFPASSTNASALTVDTASWSTRILSIREVMNLCLDEP
jgi:hypothetical protein